MSDFSPIPLSNIKKQFFSYSNKPLLQEKQDDKTLLSPETSGILFSPIVKAKKGLLQPLSSNQMNLLSSPPRKKAPESINFDKEKHVLELAGYSQKLSQSVLGELNKKAAEMRDVTFESLVESDNLECRFNKSHQRQFNKMDSISNHYSAIRRRKQMEQRKRKSVEPMKRIEMEEEQLEVIKTPKKDQSKRGSDIKLGSGSKRRRTIRGPREVPDSFKSGMMSGMATEISTDINAPNEWTLPGDNTESIPSSKSSAKNILSRNTLLNVDNDISMLNVMKDVSMINDSKVEVLRDEKCDVLPDESMMDISVINENQIGDEEKQKMIHHLVHGKLDKDDISGDDDNMVKVVSGNSPDKMSRTSPEKGFRRSPEKNISHNFSSIPRMSIRNSNSNASIAPPTIQHRSSNNSLRQTSGESIVRAKSNLKSYSHSSHSNLKSQIPSNNNLKSYMSGTSSSNHNLKSYMSGTSSSNNNLKSYMNGSSNQHSKTESFKKPVNIKKANSVSESKPAHFSQSKSLATSRSLSSETSKNKNPNNMRPPSLIGTLRSSNSNASLRNSELRRAPSNQSLGESTLKAKPSIPRFLQPTAASLSRQASTTKLNKQPSMRSISDPLNQPPSIKVVSKSKSTNELQNDIRAKKELRYSKSTYKLI